MIIDIIIDIIIIIIIIIMIIISSSSVYCLVFCFVLMVAASGRDFKDQLPPLLHKRGMVLAVLVHVINVVV